MRRGQKKTKAETSFLPGPSQRAFSWGQCLFHFTMESQASNERPETTSTITQPLIGVRSLPHSAETSSLGDTSDRQPIGAEPMSSSWQPWSNSARLRPNPNISLKRDWVSNQSEASVREQTTCLRYRPDRGRRILAAHPTWHRSFLIPRVKIGPPIRRARIHGYYT